MPHPILLLFLLVSLSCSSNPAPPVAEEQPTEVPEHIPPAIKSPIEVDTSKHNRYSWKEDYSTKDMLVNRILPPEGFRRVPVAKNSYADWLRHLPLQPEGSPVYLYDGSLKGRQDVHAAVIDIDIGTSDLQQCADAVMRLQAEYLYSQQAYDRIHFNFTSGDKVSFEDWRRGKKPQINGNRVTFSEATSSVDNSYLNFKSYLRKIFMYAGTASLSKELKPVAVNEVQAGDVFIQGGFPGHAVIV